MKNIEFEIAVKKLDLLNNKICFAEEEADRCDESLLVLNFISVQLLNLLEDFILNPIVFNEFLKFSENFYNKNKHQYEIDYNSYIKSLKNIKNHKKRFEKISNQLEFLNNKQR